MKNNFVIISQVLHISLYVVLHYKNRIIIIIFQEKNKPECPIGPNIRICLYIFAVFIMENDKNYSFGTNKYQIQSIIQTRN